jgi:hypothetical protein
MSEKHGPAKANQARRRFRKKYPHLIPGQALLQL